MILLKKKRKFANIAERSFFQEEAIKSIAIKNVNIKAIMKSQKIEFMNMNVQIAKKSIRVK